MVAVAVLRRVRMIVDACVLPRLRMVRCIRLETRACSRDSSGAACRRDSSGAAVATAGPSAIGSKTGDSIVVAVTTDGPAVQVHLGADACVMWWQQW